MVSGGAMASPLLRLPPIAPSLSLIASRVALLGPHGFFATQ